MAQEGIPPSLVDPITYELFEDPVIASDNHTYERESILQWWAACASRGEPLLSPLTRERMTRELRPNLLVRQLVSDFLEQQKRREVAEAESKRRADESKTGSSAGFGVSSLSEETSSLAALGRVFAAVDPLRDLLQNLHWEPPQIVVMGNENTGKSTLLERICMMPLFPTDKSICTRMVIKICLRRGHAQIPQLEERSMDGRTVHERLAVPMDRAAQRIQEVMVQEVRKENGGCVAGVCRSKMLVLHVVSPQVPNLDLVDLPGLVAASVQGEPEDMTQQTRALVEMYLDQHAAHSMYLVTVPANAAANQSIAMDIIQRRGLQQLTIGVFTKCDLVDVAVDSDDEGEDIRSRFQDLVDKLDQTAGDVIPLQPHGYVATMNKKPKKRFPSGHEALVYQAEKEPRWFLQRGLDPMAEGGRVAAGALIARLMSMYHSYAMITWLPGVLGALDDEKQRVEAADRELGLPRAHDAMVTEVKQLVEAATATFTQVLLEEAEPVARELQQLFSADNAFQRGIAERATWEERLDQLRRDHATYLRQRISEAVTLTTKCFVAQLQNDISPFKWGRFDRAIRLFQKQLTNKLLICVDAVQARVDAMLDHFYTMPWNPYIKTNCHREFAAQIEWEIDFHDFNNSVVQAVLGPMLRTLSEFDVALSVPAQRTLWVESCAQYRLEILERLGMLESSEEHLFRALALSQEVIDGIFRYRTHLVRRNRMIEQKIARLAAGDAELVAARKKLEDCNTRCSRAESELVQALRNYYREAPSASDSDAQLCSYHLTVRLSLNAGGDNAATAMDWIQRVGWRNAKFMPAELHEPTERTKQAWTERESAEKTYKEMEARKRRAVMATDAGRVDDDLQHAYQQFCELVGVPVAAAKQTPSVESQSAGKAHSSQRQAPARSVAHPLNAVQGARR